MMNDKNKEILDLPLFEEIETYLDEALVRLSPWLSDPVNGDDSLTIGSVIKNLKSTVLKIKERSMTVTLENWVEQFKKQHESMGMAVTFNELGEKVNLCPVIQNELTCVMQEACGNAVKHGKAGMIQILVIYGEEDIKITIADNGAGISLDKIQCKKGCGAGLKNIKERIKRIGGKVDFFNKEIDTGAIILVAIPYGNRTQRSNFFPKNLGRELHDVLCPELIAAVLILSSCQTKLSEQDAKKWCELQCVVEKLNEYSIRLRALSHALDE